MVSVNEMLAESFAQQMEVLRRQFAPSLETASPEAGFIRYALSELGSTDKVDFGLAVEDSPRPLLVSAPDLASAGYLGLVAPERVSPGLVSAWCQSFDRLREKDAFPLDRQAFTFRPLEFLGICIGAREFSGKTSEAVLWLHGLVPTLRSKVHGRWAHWLCSAANVVLKGNDDYRDAFETDDLPTDELALLLWLRSATTFAEAGFWRELDTRDLQEIVLRRFSTQMPEARDPARAALMYRMLELSVTQLLQSEVGANWNVGRPTTDALEVVTMICRRFNRVAQQLRSRHDNRSTLTIKDEYDVQDLLHSMLCLFFDDVREEVWTPNYAGSSSRTDFVLWKESLIVEAKMTRKNLGQKEIADQLIIDRERYAADERCKTLVCFVYDPEGRCKNPAALENDLSQDSDPRVRVIVFSNRR
jgi:hypothetical protein